MVVHNLSNISGDDAYKSLIQSARKQSSRLYIYIVATILIGVPLLIVGLTRLDSQYITMAGIFLLLSITLIVYSTIMYFQAPKDIKKKNEEIIRDGVTYDFTFKEKSCDLIVINSGKKAKTNYPYTEFKKIFEYSDRFVIRLSSNDVIICLKNGFSGEKDKMIEFFKKNVSTNKKLTIVDKQTK